MKEPVHCGDRTGSVLLFRFFLLWFEIVLKLGCERHVHTLVDGVVEHLGPDCPPGIMDASEIGGFLIFAPINLTIEPHFLDAAGPEFNVILHKRHIAEFFVARCSDHGIQPFRRPLGVPDHTGPNIIFVERGESFPINCCGVSSGIAPRILRGNSELLVPQRDALRARCEVVHGIREPCEPKRIGRRRWILRR